MLLRYLRWEKQLRLLPLMLRARRGDPTAGPDLLRAVATTAYPIEESYLRDAAARDQARGITRFTDFTAKDGRPARHGTGRRCANSIGPPWSCPAMPIPCSGPEPSGTLPQLSPARRLVILPDVGHALPPAIWPIIARQMRALADNHASA